MTYLLPIFMIGISSDSVAFLDLMILKVLPQTRKIERKCLCEEILNKLSSHNLLISAPPFPGKTALTQLMEHRAKKSGFKVIAMAFTDYIFHQKQYLHEKVISEEKIFITYVKEKTNYDWQDIIKDPNILFIMDDAHLIFHVELTEISKDWSENIDEKAMNFISNGHLSAKLEQHINMISPENLYEAFFSFSCPVIEQFYQQEYVKEFIYTFSPQIESLTIENDGLIGFIYKVVNQIDGSLLCKTYSKSATRVYQNEFYHAVWAIIPGRLSPDVGTYFGVRGAVNFYLNGQFKWAFEFLHDGIRIKEHSEHFKPNGKIVMNDWATIDLCISNPMSSKIAITDDRHYFRVLISNDCQFATIEHTGKDHKVPLKWVEE
ncbi:15911_t:CDS:2 [Entrophospora sp. SA101]|nr:15911_t:CDS:2 [Entrophospora sp. SA101]